MIGSSRTGSSGGVEEKRMSVASSSLEEGDPYAINGVHFNRDMFISKIIQDYPLDKLMQTEKKLIREIGDLGSDMQTLVYENYNKFILATDTIRKMKTDFKEMEDKMSLLSQNIAKITDSSSKIASSLQGNRLKVNKFSSIHDLLKKLKFLFELPNTLKQHSEEFNYEEAVRCYLNGLQFMEEFKRFPSLEAIKADCQEIMAGIMAHLEQDFDDDDKSSQDLTRNVSLLLSLNADASVLADKFLNNATPRLNLSLESLKTASNPNVSLEEFMELSCGIFLSNLSLVIASFSQAFIQTAQVNEDSKQASRETSRKFVLQLLTAFLEILESRLTIEIHSLRQQEPEAREGFLKTLDRLYRRLMAISTLLPDTDFMSHGLALILKIIQLDAKLSLERIEECYEKSVKESGFELRSHPGSTEEILGSILANMVGQMKSGLDILRDYTQSDYTFAQHADFRQRVAISIVREGYVVGFFRYLIAFGKKLLEDGRSDNMTWLLIAKLYLEIELSTVAYMINSVEVDYDIKRDRRNLDAGGVTSVSEITSGLNLTAKKLLEEFVASLGNQIGELLREAVLHKDLISLTAEPLGPQPQMRKIVDILARTEKFIECIFPDTDPTTHLDRSSDSSKRSYCTLPSGGIASKSLPPPRPTWPNNYDPNMSSNIQKLFSEKVEIFGDVGFQKSEILMSVVKIGLRALLEIVRVKTLGKSGLHQIQVDVHYLQLYLWRFVNNEGFLSFLLDEILASSIQRCVDPIQLESTLVEILAEKLVPL